MARDLHLKREQDKVVETQRKRDDKDKRTLAKLHKEQEKARKRLERAVAKEAKDREEREKKEVKEATKLQRMADQQLFNESKPTKEKKQASPVKKKVQKPPKKVVIALEVEEVPELAASRSRASRRLPDRFRN